MIDQGWVRGGATHRRPGAHVDGLWFGDSHGGGSHGRVEKESQTLILASNVEGCTSLEGQLRWEGRSFNGGSLCAKEVEGLSRVRMLAGRGYAGDALSWVHDPLPLESSAARTLVRLNVQH